MLGVGGGVGGKFSISTGGGGWLELQLHAMVMEYNSYLQVVCVA